MRPRAFLIALCLLLAACSAAPEGSPATDIPLAPTLPPPTPTPAVPRAEVTTSPATPVPAALPERCRPGNDAQAPYLDTESGYCLLYPTAYSITGRRDGGVRFASRPIESDGGLLHTYIDVRHWPADGDLATVVSRHLAQQFPSQAPVSRPATAGAVAALRVEARDEGGETAVHYFVVAGGRLYDLSFGPAATDGPAALDVAALERTVVRTFDLLPPGMAERLAVCPEPADGELAFINLAGGYCFLFPRGWQLRQNVPLSSVILDGDLGDDAPARVSVTINSGGQAAGRSPDAIVADYLAEFTPELRPQVRQSEGELDGRRLLILDNIPGRFATRQAFAVTGDRLYSLTFTPFEDPALAALQSSLAASWEALMGSFRFLEAAAP